MTQSSIKRIFVGPANLKAMIVCFPKSTVMLLDLVSAFKENEDRAAQAVRHCTDVVGLPAPGESLQCPAWKLTLETYSHVRSASRLAATPQRCSEVHSLLSDIGAVSLTPDGAQPSWLQVPFLRDVRRLRQLSHWPLVASWSHAHWVVVSYVSGKKNVWADELSRDKLDRFRSKPLACFRFMLSQLCQPEGITLYPPTQGGGKIV